MNYNPKFDAIKKLRTKKSGLDDFFNPEELKAGVQDLNEQNRTTDLAPDIKKGTEIDIEIEPNSVSVESEDLPDTEAEMNLQANGGDQGDAIPKGMYEPGDENMKGFMGKAARKMKQFYKG